MPTIRVAPSSIAGNEKVLTKEAIDFVVHLDQLFHARRDERLVARKTQREIIANGGTLDFLPSTKAIRDGQWKVAQAPADLLDRRVEITGPTDPKMAINALNSGAKVWLADLEDSNTPHWSNVVEGQLTLQGVARRNLTFTSPEGKSYKLKEGPLATLIVRPRGWHLLERHVTIDGK